MIATDVQEQLSLAALHATAARAGFAFSISGRILDNWGRDCTIHVKERLHERSTLTEFDVKVQAKATRQELSHADGRFSFPLDVRHYDDLREATGKSLPVYLVVFHMPHDEGEWLACSPEQLVLRECLRWVSLRGAGPVTTATKTVYIPEAQVLTPRALRDLATFHSVFRDEREWPQYDPDGKPADLGAAVGETGGLQADSRHGNR